MTFKDDSGPRANDDELAHMQERRERREELAIAKKRLNELTQRVEDTLKTRYFGGRCLDQLSSLLHPTPSDAPSGAPKSVSASAPECGDLIRTSPETSWILQRLDDLEVQGNSVYTAVARLIAHLLSSTVDRPLLENTKDPESFLHLCFPNPVHEFWGVRCPAWRQWPETSIASEDVFELISHSAQLSPLLRITDSPAALIDLMNHPSLVPAREAMIQAGQVVIIDTQAMQRLGVRYGRSTTMADRYLFRAEGGDYVKEAKQQAPPGIAADEGNGLLHAKHWIVERWIPAQVVRGTVRVSDFLTICRENKIVDATDHVTDQKAYEIPASILLKSPPQPDTIQQPLGDQIPEASRSANAADAAQPRETRNPTATSFKPPVPSSGNPQHPASTTHTKSHFPRLAGNPIRISKPGEPSDRSSSIEEGDQTKST